VGLVAPRIGTPAPAAYERRRPELSTLYAVVKENLETLYGAVDDAAVPIALPAFVRKELDGYLSCGLLCRGFAHVLCGACGERRLVAFGCGGRGFCPSCLGRKMSSTALNLMECVLPPAPLRQWVLTFPFAWHARLGFDAPLLGALARLFVQTVLGFYAERMKKEGLLAGKSGAVVVVQRTASDVRLQPHLHVVFLDGVYREQGEGVVFAALPRLSTREVGEVLEKARGRIVRHLARRGLLGESESGDAEAEGHAALCASAARGDSPPAGPELRRRGPLAALEGGAVRWDKELCASLDGFTLHAATRAGAMDSHGREALLKYILRPPIAQERVTRGPEGLVRILLKKPFSDGTFAVDLDPLSLLCRLAASVPAPGTHTVRYAGVLGSASKLRARIVPAPPPAPGEEDSKGQRAPERARWRRAQPWMPLSDVGRAPAHAGHRRPALPRVQRPHAGPGARARARAGQEVPAGQGRGDRPARTSPGARPSVLGQPRLARQERRRRGVDGVRHARHPSARPPGSRPCPRVPAPPLSRPNVTPPPSSHRPTAHPPPRFAHPWAPRGPLCFAPNAA